MDLRSGMPFFFIKNGLPFNYPKLEQSISTEVAILGGGISGALMAYHLTQAGIEAVVVDARTIALGSTAASTSLLQYEIDVPLHELIEKRGFADATRSFVLCNEAIDKLKDIAQKIGMKYFSERKSLYFAASKNDLKSLKKEYEIRKEIGFDVDYLDARDVQNQYGFKSDGAILSHHGAQVDAYSFTHSLLQHSISNGLKVFDRTGIKKIHHLHDHIQLKTGNGNSITARKIVNATGYEVVNFINKKIVRLQSTYAIISEHTEDGEDWRVDTMMWNTADPYLYITAVDGRIIIGGRDENFYNPTKRDKLIKSKSRMLLKDFQKLFPEIPFRPEFSWTGTFGSTKDGLPYIGTYGNHPNTYYALGFGGNGITFSLIAAEILTDLITGKNSKDAHIFSFNR